MAPNTTKSDPPAAGAPPPGGNPPPIETVPLLTGSLAMYLTPTALHGIPLVGLPGCVCPERRDVLRARPVGQMEHLVQQFNRKAIGGIGLLRVVRSPRWQAARQMLVWAIDIAHIHRLPLVRLPWWDDAECEVWALQAFQP